MPNYDNITEETNKAIEAAKTRMVAGKVAEEDVHALQKIVSDLKQKSDDISSQISRLDNFLDYTEADSNSLQSM